MNPTVSFVIPCYKLAHLLPECIHSILGQTYTDFEILIMDDCSPDNTPEVAQSFGDPRVKHVRNEPNLGHLRNYNKGIEMSRGKYVWLISADDRLRSTQVLERFVDVMDKNPNVGYAFSRGMGMEGGEDRGILAWADCGETDGVWSGKKFLERLLESNCVIASSGMVKKECYDKLTLFPLDLPYAGDWYLWCIFALHYDVAYFQEPMMSYRLHEDSMTNNTTRKKRLADNLAVRWRMKSHAQAAGAEQLRWQAIDSLATHYIYCVNNARFQTSDYGMTIEEFEESLSLNQATADELPRIRGRVYAGLGDGSYQREEFDQALKYYRMGLGHNPWMAKVWVKLLLLHFGSVGTAFRRRFMAQRAALAEKGSGN